jgi:hypothetical protein
MVRSRLPFVGASRTSAVEKLHGHTHCSEGRQGRSPLCKNRGTDEGTVSLGNVLPTCLIAPWIPLYSIDSIEVALNGMEEVIGSIPIRSTNKPLTKIGCWLLAAKNCGRRAGPAFELHSTQRPRCFSALLKPGSLGSTEPACYSAAAFRQGQKPCLRPSPPRIELQRCPTP